MSKAHIVIAHIGHSEIDHTLLAAITESGITPKIISVDEKEKDLPLLNDAVKSNGITGTSFTLRNPNYSEFTNDCYKPPRKQSEGRTCYGTVKKRR